MQDSQYTISPFGPQDVELYKAIRLEALQLEAGVFGSSYARESAFTREQWLERIINKNSVCYGLFYGDALIGLTGVVVDRDDPTLAHMVQSYICKAHRGKGLSRMLYDTRIEWAKHHPGLKILRTGHRESNTASKAANQHYDFRFFYRETTDWPDGGREDVLYYDMEL